jgi:predicted small lipoprotein YifL
LILMTLNIPCIRFALVLALVALASACGVKGGLETAPPMWGDARAQYEAEQAAKRAAEEDEKKREAEAAAQPSAATPPSP